MNKNQKKIEDAILNKIPLNTLSFSPNFSDFKLTNCELEGLHLKNAYFKNSECTNIKFIECSFIGCGFENAKFSTCSFLNCLIDSGELKETLVLNSYIILSSLKNIMLENSEISNCSFSDTNIESCNIYQVEFKKIGLHKCSIETSTLFLSNFFEFILKESIIKELELDSCKSLDISIENNSFIKTNIFRVKFDNLLWNENNLLKTNMIKCEGVSRNILDDIIKNNGRIETYLSVLIKNKMFLFFFIIIVVFFINFIVKVSFTKKYLFARYIINEVWSDPFRHDLSRETRVILNLFFENNLRKLINDAISLKNEKNFKSAKEVYYNSLIALNNDKSRYIEYSWIISELFIISENELEWENSWKFIELNIPFSIKQDLRLVMIMLLERKYYSDVTLKIIKKFLLENDNIEMLIKLNDIINNFNITYIDFKLNAYQIIRSFAKRNILIDLKFKDSYTYIIENADEWIKYYSSIKNNH